MFAAVALGSPILALFSWVGGLTGCLFTVMTASPGMLAPVPVYYPPPPPRRPWHPHPINGSSGLGLPPRQPSPALTNTTSTPTTTTTTTTLAPLEQWPALYGGGMATDGIYVGFIMGLFWLPTPSSVFMLLFMALATAMTKNALATIFYVWGLPTLALPFGLTMMLLLLNHKHLPRLIHIDITQMTVPEDHLCRFRNVRRVAKQLTTLLVSGQEMFDSTRRQVEDQVALAAKHKLKFSVSPASMRQVSLSRDNAISVLAECGVVSYAEDWQGLDTAHQAELDAWFATTDVESSGFISLDALVNVIAEAINASQVQRTVDSFFEVMGSTAAKGYLWHLEVSTSMKQAGIELSEAHALRLYARPDFVLTKEDLAKALLPLRQARVRADARPTPVATMVEMQSMLQHVFN